MSGQQEKEVSFVETFTQNRCYNKKCLEDERKHLNGGESYLPRKILRSFTKFMEKWSSLLSLYLLCAPKLASRIM